MTGVVVGVDGSPHARKALAWAIDEAERRATPLTAVRVLAPVPNNVFRTYPENRGCTAADLAATHDQLDDLVEKAAADRGHRIRVPVHCRARVGDAALELVRAARDADLLVVGSRGTSQLRRVLLGSVSSAVARHATCPVVIVPADDRAHAA